MSWDEVRVGDWVRVKSVESDTEVTGTVVEKGGMWSASIGALSLLPSRWEVVETRPVYKQGDIGLLKRGFHGNYLGVYSETSGYFYAHNQRMFSAEEEDIRILGNVND